MKNRLQIIAVLLLIISFASCKKNDISNDSGGNSGNEPSTIVTVNPLCFTAEEEGVTIEMIITGYHGQTDYIPYIEYSYDTIYWEKFSIATTLISLENIGDKVYFRGNNPLGLNAGCSYYSVSFKTNEQKTAVSGNVMTLIDPTGESISAPAYCFASLFAETSITTAPELPATQIGKGCYAGMFAYCNNLETAPHLPATELAKSCYVSMFTSCENLITAPQLPATVLADDCYQSMFYCCKSLMATPELPATTLADFCYRLMFWGCESITTTPELPATTCTQYCYHMMFRNCISLTTVCELPATTMADNCYSCMFVDCYNLTSVPEVLPATTLADECYVGMFSGCENITTAPDIAASELTQDCCFQMFLNCNKLNSIKVGFTGWGIYNETFNWLRNVSPTGTFYCPASLPQEFGESRIPEGWTVETF